MENLKAVCLKKQNQITGVHIYLHTLTNVTDFRIKISLGRFNRETSSDAELEVQSNRDSLDETIFDSNNVNSYHAFKYRARASHIVLEVFEAKEGSKRIA